MQDMRNTGNRSKGCRTGGVPYREAGQEGCRKGGTQDYRWMRERRDAGQEGFGRGGIKEYILVIERTAAPSVFQTCVHATSPCSVRSIDRVHQVVYSNYLTVTGRGYVITSLEDAGGCCAFYH